MNPDAKAGSLRNVYLQAAALGWRRDGSYRRPRGLISGGGVSARRRARDESESFDNQDGSLRLQVGTELAPQTRRAGC